MKSLKVLVSVYACRPNQGSEPGVGWNVVQELAKHHRVWVLTRADNRAAIEDVCSQESHPNVIFLYCDPPGPTRYLKPAQVPHYYFWQLGAYAVAKQLHRQMAFDLVHHVTYVRYSTPSFLTLLPIPFIWGPVGGGESTPLAFWQDFSLKARVYECLRTLTHRLGELDPFAQVTARRSTLARATTPATAQRLQLMGAQTIQTQSALGLSQAELALLGDLAPPPVDKIRLISIARLLHWKGLHLGLRAFAQANLPNNVEYVILGDGPERDSLECLARDLEIEHQVKFLGPLPRVETLTHLATCYALVHPSLHDSGGLVCLEAMAAGRPVVCLDTGGPALQVTENTGIKVPAHNPQQVVAGLADAIATLVADPSLCVRLGRAGKHHVQENFSWATKGEQLAQLYVDLVVS